jgi:predicted dehydrogenase
MSEREPVPVAVVGAGNMGMNHIRVYDELPEANLVAVVEPDPDRAATVADDYDVPVYDTVSDTTDAEASTLAVPNEYHRAVAIDCLDAGLDILVEKPLAMTVDDAAAITEAAEASNAVLQVGHIERFNPAVEVLHEILSNQSLIAIEAHRLGPFNEHLSKESVVFDLMIHDLEIITALVDSRVSSVNAFGADPKSATIDHAVAQVQFESGVLGTLTASQVTHDKVRTLSIVTEESYIRLDYQKQSITVRRAGQEGMTVLSTQTGYRTETVTESPYIQTREPLKNELEHFLDCVATRTIPRVDGRVGTDAVRLATSVVEIFTNNEK